MAGEHLQAQARRVVTGVDGAGRSTFDSDGPTPVRRATEGFTICDIWQVEKLPVNVMDGDASTGEVLLDPPLTGFVYRVTTFPPDSEWDPAAGYAASLEALGGADAMRDGEGSDIAGLHETDTVDIVTLLSGELYAITESGETLLKPGDSIVTRGTKHSWSNRTDKPCTLVCVQCGATR
ncbi:cupin domain-containing protein [Pseudofrankia sp. BMG5.36]|uniref:cupin domain-containing protein n=2 Tax=unclassified Pseudofrankia TaxID=2994372 RepID=UPI0008DB32C5|nr:cupin domain-containing protein [Pseudofrankia sp. BMG5.36]OHV64833.1 cupin [Pseudofrankia sp. BMG5.36]